MTMSEDQQQNDRIDAIKTVELGIQSESFLASPLGKYVIGRAESEIAEALERLKILNPFTFPEELRTEQNKIWRAESFQRWIAEAIQDGWQAENALRQDE